MVVNCVSTNCSNLHYNFSPKTPHLKDFPISKPYLLYFQTCRAEQKGNNTFEVYFDNFAPGSVVAFDITMETQVKNALGKLR